MTTHRRLAPLAGAILLVLAACSSGGAPASSGGPSAAGSASTAPLTAAPSPSDSPPPDPGVTDPGGSDPPDVDPGGQAKLVQPVPGAFDPHDANATRVIPALNGRHLAVQVEWFSGVAPCTVLAGVVVDREGSTFTLTVRDGIGDRDTMCIEIAELHATIVDLGELEPGTYTIKATGDAAPVQVTIP